MAFRETVRAMCRAKTTTPKIALIFEALDEIETGEERDSAIKDTVRRLSRDVRERRRPARELSRLLDLMEKCSSSATRARCLGEVSVAICDYSGTDISAGRCR